MTDLLATLSKLGVEIDAYSATVDNILVIHIDTPELPEDSDGPLCRIYLNDEVIHENPAYPIGAQNARTD